MNLLEMSLHVLLALEVPPTHRTGVVTLTKMDMLQMDVQPLLPGVGLVASWDFTSVLRLFILMGPAVSLQVSFSGKLLWAFRTLINLIQLLDIRLDIL